MILFPAIDILNGRAVRLVKGDFDDQTVYQDDPLDAARGWCDGGARYLHVVDLDGARKGEPVNLQHLRRIVETLAVPVQYGGGLRTVQAVKDALAAGAQRVVLGTAAYADPDFLDEVLATYGDQVLVAVDVRGGHVTTAGWTHSTGDGMEVVIERLQARGVASFIYTNVDRDGMLEGPNLDEVKRVAAVVGGSLIYSGGIGELEDLKRLARLDGSKLTGVIVGKALYERRFTVAQGMAALEE